jgi:Rrf2 family protein
MALRLTKAADYAVVAMIHMACLPEEAVELRGDIALAHEIPSSFMAKILRCLVKARLLRSSRGVHGGFTLARPAAEITLLDIIEAVEGPLNLTDCSHGPGGCERAAECSAQPVWYSIQAKIAGLLREATLEDVVSAPHRRSPTLLKPVPPVSARRASES